MMILPTAFAVEASPVAEISTVDAQSQPVIMDKIPVKAKNIQLTINLTKEQAYDFILNSVFNKPGIELFVKALDEDSVTVYLTSNSSELTTDGKLELGSVNSSDMFNIESISDVKITDGENELGCWQSIGESDEELDIPNDDNDNLEEPDDDSSLSDSDNSNSAGTDNGSDNNIDGDSGSEDSNHDKDEGLGSNNSDSDNSSSDDNSSSGNSSGSSSFSGSSSGGSNSNIKKYGINIVTDKTLGSVKVDNNYANSDENITIYVDPVDG